MWGTRWGIDPAVLHAKLREANARDAQPNENPRAWASLGGGVRVAPGFTADAAVSPRLDPLGHAEEARRLAELACLGANMPPMAVALFGDWGSGKSTFMARMQDAVAELGTTWRNAETSPFATRVAQIRFNAWTYADGDLWASMAAEIFRQLRSEIARLSDEPQDRLQKVASAQYRALIDRVALRVGAAEAAQSEALGQLARINRELDAKRGELERVDRRAAEMAAAPAAARLMERAQAALTEKPQAVGAALAALGIAAPDDARKLEALVGEARQAAHGAGKARLLWRTLVGVATGPDALLWLGAAAVLAWLLWLLLPALLAGSGMVAAVAAAVLARAKPILDAARAFADAEASESASLAARRTTLEAEISALRGERETKEAAQTHEAAFMARYAGAAKGESPAALLKFFLEQDAGLQAYEQRLGMVSRLRESFETLEALLAEQAGKPGGTLPAIDRIILYVDDLDRCQPAQVVPVLQALALMLQLKLFVAVVAVDDRWLKAALRIHYKDLLAEEAMSSPEQFLEKIFQIPFWLRPMQGGNDERYASFVAHLVPEVGAAVAPDNVIRDTRGQPILDMNGQPLLDTSPPIDPDESPQPDDMRALAHENLGDTIERVSLTQPELQVLTALAPLAGGTPRAVKRFVNLYRLIRSSRQGEALSAFLGADGSLPGFVASAFALACESGLSSAQGSTLRDFVKAMGSGLMTDLTRQNPASGWQLDTPTTLQVPSPIAALDGQAGEQIAEAIAALERIIPAVLRAEHLNIAWHEAARFSFNRPA